MIIDGRELSLEILNFLKGKRKNFERLKIAAFLIGQDEEKLSFLKQKQKFAQELEIEFKIYQIDENLNKKKIRKYISQIVKHKTINGAILQLPLPEKFQSQTQYLLNSIPPKKDIDCLSSRMLGKFYTDHYLIRPPVVEVVDFLKGKFNLDFENKKILIVGYGKLVGKPLAHYFAKTSKLVTILKDSNNKKIFLDYDLIVSGVGKANLIDDCRDGAILIDFGYSIINGKIFGDINFEKLKDKASLITKTPGGTGPILVAKLFENLFKLLETKTII